MCSRCAELEVEAKKNRKLRRELQEMAQYYFHWAWLTERDGNKDDAGVYRRVHGRIKRLLAGGRWKIRRKDDVDQSES